MKHLDVPPVWLLGSIVITWALARFFPQTVADIAFTDQAAWLLLAIAFTLMALALREMRRAKTTFVPREDPSALVTGGIFRLSRNPMYLAMEILLLAAILWTGSVAALPLLWIFPKVIVSRFIEDEENKMHEFFGAAFDAWAARTRRWL
ncbi:MAG: isoprenylcysteine carboxylmethyltransferase family protein [Paracoccaceae bacterium]